MRDYECEIKDCGRTDALPCGDGIYKTFLCPAHAGKEGYCAACGAVLAKVGTSKRFKGACRTCEGRILKVENKL